MTAPTEEINFAKHIEFPAKPENLALAEKLIDEVCAQYQVPESLYGNILIALTEAVNNAIHHGNQEDPDKQVVLGYAVDGDQATFVVSDQGPGFDFEHLPDPTDPQNIERPHGRGVFLMRALADKVEFTDNGATVSITFDLTEPKV